MGEVESKREEGPEQVAGREKAPQPVDSGVV